MNRNVQNEVGTSPETLNLSEETSVSVTEGVTGYIKNLFKALRRSFSKKSENSILSGLIDTLYTKALSCRAKTVAVFLLSFGVSSLIIGYVLSTTFGGFISDKNTFFALVLLIIGLLLFTSGKTFHALFASSKILSPLSIVYSDEKSSFSENIKCTNESVYSTPFFLGFICGIFSGIYPVSVICTFIAALFCVVFIFNRPECGLLLTILILPFMSPVMLLVFTCITFLSLLFRFLRGKRHIDFDISTLLIVISVLYVAIRCAFAGEGAFSGRFYIYISFYIFCITAMNLIRSTSMFRRTVQVIIRMTRIFAVILVAYYIGNMVFGTNTVGQFVVLLNMDDLVSALTSRSFVSPFLSMAVPMNFSYIVGSNKKNDVIKNVLYFLLLLACLLYVSSYAIILISVLSCVLILIFFNKRYAFLILPAPAVAYGLYRLFLSIPARYRLSASSGEGLGLKKAIEMIKINPAFGNGPDAVGYAGNMLLNIAITFGFVGLALLAVLLVFITIKTAKYVSADIMKSDKARFLSIGLLCAQLSFLSLCIFTDIYCGFDIVFMFAAVISASVASGRCYKADYIDATIVREYRNR